SGYGRDPGTAGARYNRPNARDDEADAVIVIARNPVDVPFDAEDEVADLVIEADLASPNEPAVAAVGERQSTSDVGHVTMPPGSSDVGTDVEAGPAKGHHHRHHGRRLYWQIGGLADPR